MGYAIWNQAGLAVCASLGLDTAFYPALRLRRATRAVVLALVLGAIWLSPLLIAGRARFLRLLAILLVVTVSVRLYDAHVEARAGRNLKFPTFLACLLNPFALVMRLVLSEKPLQRRHDAVRLATGLIVGGITIAAMARVFGINWRAYPFALEHCSKVVSLFLMIQFLPNGLAAEYRLAGLPATNFAGDFFLAATPAEFWRRYNRPASQFLSEYVFKPSGGLRHPIGATLVTFAFSGVVHEYVFDLSAGRILGTEMLFFALQGVASVATVRVRPTGWIRGPCILLALAFNLATARIFFASVNAVISFYVPRT